MQGLGRDLAPRASATSSSRAPSSQRVKGGLSVTIRGGVKAFLPGSQVDLRPVRNLDKLIGQTYKFKVIKFNKKRGNIVLSRRVLLEKERDELKERDAREPRRKGMIVKGVVKNITEYGAFIDLGGIDGLLHITDMSWGRVNHPREVFQVGDEVTRQGPQVQPRDRARLASASSRSRKIRGTTPTRSTRPARASRARSSSLTDYGAFIELEQGIEGLVHVSEMSWTKRVKHPSKLVDVGDEVEAVVLDIDAKAEAHQPRHEAARAESVDAARGEVPARLRHHAARSATSPTSASSSASRRASTAWCTSATSRWTQRVKHPGELYQKGDEVEAVVAQHRRRERALQPRHQAAQRAIRGTTLSERYPVGKSVEGKVTKVLDFGAFVEIEQGIEGLVHVSEMQRRARREPARRGEGRRRGRGEGHRHGPAGAQGRAVREGAAARRRRRLPRVPAQARATAAPASAT